MFSITCYGLWGTRLANSSIGKDHINTIHKQRWMRGEQCGEVGAEQTANLTSLDGVNVQPHRLPTQGDKFLVLLARN